MIEVNQQTLNIVKTYTAHGTVSGAAFGSLLPGGNVLITDRNNNRVIMVDKNDNIVFQYVTNSKNGSNPNPLPTRAIVGHGKNIVISDQFNNRVIVIDQNGNLLKQYGNLNVIGYGTSNTQQGLYAPYSAYVIGDYIGLTKP